MSDILVLDRPAAQKKVKRAGKVRSVLRVLRGEAWVGDILLDRRERVWGHVSSVPADVVLKALAAFTRGAERGELTGRRCGLSYVWHVVEEQAERATGEPEVPAGLAEAA